MFEFHKTLKPFDRDTAPKLQINCSGKLRDSRILDIDYELCGDLLNIELSPQVDSTGRADDLWLKTCFELFVKTPDFPRYWEYNLSSSGQWAAYGFSQYREGRYDDESISDISVDSSFTDNRFIIKCGLPLPAELYDQSLKIGISAVIQTKTDGLYYYALEHCKNKADFHDENSFVLTFEPD